jgi:hypothetical protein
MDKDFHFSTIYVLSRWAGFSSYNSLVLATASQFVDDNTATISRNKRPSGHDPWQNVTIQEENNNIWIPFHFLPGLEGTTREERLICKKNSSFANLMMHELPPIAVDDSISMFRLGIALHVYADTWAHQEFSGIDSLWNEVDGLTIHRGNSENELSDDVAANSPLLLGHVQAMHWPDRPYAAWSSDTKFATVRNNWDEFIEAAKHIYSYLTTFHHAAHHTLTKKQINLLLYSFKDNVSTTTETRTNSWIKNIHANLYDFEDFEKEDAAIHYSTSLIIYDADFSTQFYDALNAHYDWVKKGLEVNDIYKLK